MTHGVILEPDGGGCIANFRLCQWRYELWYWAPEFEWETGYYEVKIYLKDELASSLNKWINGSSTTTCEDDLESFTYAGYSSHEFNVRYESCDHTYYNEAPGTYTVYVSWWGFLSSSMYIEIPINGGSYYGSFGIKSNWWSTFEYQYHFEGGHDYYVDYLGSGENSAWAFKPKT
jgi:hypothetical protein